MDKKIDIHGLPSLRLQAYCVINDLTTTTKDRFSSSEVANYLIEKVGVRTSRQAIEYVLKSDGSACHKNKQGYKLMQKGKDELSGSSGLTLIDANKPYVAKNFTLKDIIGSDYKELSICDAYLDLNTLDVVYKNFLKDIPTKILTANIINKPEGVFKRQLSDLNKEGFRVEVRVYDKSVLHDRYLIDDNHIWLCGNSLNYIGNKESFIVSLGEDMRQSMLATFNSRWKVSKQI